MRSVLLFAALAPAVTFAASFTTPVMLEAGGAPIRVEAPGYACPSWFDWDGDGKTDLLVRQFSKGKIHFFKNDAETGAPKLRKGAWLMSGDKPAEVPGVW